MLRVRIAKELLLAVAISLICHLLYFTVIKFDFASIADRSREPDIYFLGELLDRGDFSSLGGRGIGGYVSAEPRKAGISAGQIKNNGILYKKRLLGLEKQIYFPEKNKHFFRKIKFSPRKKPLFINTPIAGKNIPFFISHRQSIGDKEQDNAVASRKLEAPFFYKELSKFATVEAELKVLTRTNILLIKRVRSSGDLEIGLFALKIMRRKRYYNIREENLPFKKVKAIFSDD